MNTLALSAGWDLTLTPAGDIAVLGAADATAQDVASALKLFIGELWYDTAAGVPYMTEIFGVSYSDALVKSLLESAALSVPNVSQAQVTSLTVSNRVASGRMTVIYDDGTTTEILF